METMSINAPPQSTDIHTLLLSADINVLLQSMDINVPLLSTVNNELLQSMDINVLLQFKDTQNPRISPEVR